MAFVYNVYTEPAHRRRGLARMIMDAIHAWCRDEGIGLVGLNASSQARPLYESMGYRADARSHDDSAGLTSPEPRAPSPSSP